jgi:hypothetical protein
MTGFFGGLEQPVLEMADAEPDSIVAETAPFAFTATGALPQIGNFNLRRMTSKGGLTTNFNMVVTTAGATLVAVFAAILGLDGSLLTVTADRSADASLVGAGVLWSPPWVNPAVLPAGDVYGGVLIGQGTLTAPQFRIFAQVNANAVNLGCTVAAKNLRAGTVGAGLSALPAFPLDLTTLAVASFNPYMACT